MAHCNYFIFGHSGIEEHKNYVMWATCNILNNYQEGLKEIIAMSYEYRAWFISLISILKQIISNSLISSELSMLQSEISVYILLDQS